MKEFKLKLESVAAIFLAALIFVSVLHAMQLNALTKTVSEQQSALGGLKEKLSLAYQGASQQARASAPQAAPQSAAPSGAQSSLPKNLQNLPNMVGGC